MARNQHQRAYANSVVVSPFCNSATRSVELLGSHVLSTERFEQLFQFVDFLI